MRRLKLFSARSSMWWRSRQEIGPRESIGSTSSCTTSCSMLLSDRHFGVSGSEPRTSRASVFQTFLFSPAATWSDKWRLKEACWQTVQLLQKVMQHLVLQVCACSILYFANERVRCWLRLIRIFTANADS